ncbi:MAG: hypothetical protein NC033_06820 [Clostridiales bacterium]|nr:hypothetical protein [Clostridiales bacterium]
MREEKTRKKIITVFTAKCLNISNKSVMSQKPHNDGLVALSFFHVEEQAINKEIPRAADLPRGEF